MRLICLDMDGVLIDDRRNIWMEAHKAFGTLAEGDALTQRYLEADYDRLVAEVVGRLWKGREAQPYLNLIESMPYMRGIKALFAFIHERDIVSAIVSAGSMHAARRIDRNFVVDHFFANELIIRDGKISGEFHGLVAEGTQEKARIVQHLSEDLNIPLSEVVYVGDTLKDLEAFRIVGCSVAFNSESDELRRAATHVVDSSDLRNLVKVLERL